MAGNTYVGVSSGNGCGIESLDRAGTVRWLSAPLFGLGACASTLALGWDGNVYVGARANGPGGVVALNSTSGAQHVFVPSADVTGLYSSASGVAVVQDAENVTFYSYSGDAVASFGGGTALGSGLGYSSTAGVNGRVFMSSNSAGCTALGVEAVTAAGIQWTWTVPTPSGCGQTLVAAVPDGGVILVSETTVWSISPSGATRWSYTPQSPLGQISSLYAPLVDAVGNVVIPYSYTYATADSPQNHGVGVDFRAAASGTTSASPVDVQEKTCTFDYGPTLSGYIQYSADIAPSQLYLSLQDDCSPYPSSIQAFAIPGLSTNYELTVTTPDYSQTAAPGLPGYVALGDSYAAGEGLNQYDPATDKPGVNECHRSRRAYPQLVFSKQSFGWKDWAGWSKAWKNQFATLPVASRACSAAKVKNLRQGQWNENGTASQLNQVGTSTKYVSVSMGGNDIGFRDLGAACMSYVTHVLFTSGDDLFRHAIRDFGVKAPDCDTAKADALQSMAGLKTDLINAYTAIGSRAPNARIVVVNYPKIMPDSFTGKVYNDSGQGTGRLCVGSHFNVGTGQIWIGLLDQDVVDLDHIEQQLNTTIAQAVAAVRAQGVNIGLADLYTFYRQHSVTCGDTGRQAPYVAGLTWSPGQLASFTCDLPFVNKTCKAPKSFGKIVSGATFHPNAAGHKAFAPLVRLVALPNWQP